MQVGRGLVAALVAAGALAMLPGAGAVSAAELDKQEELAGRIDELINELGHKDYWHRQRARDQLRRLGFRAFDALTAAENHRDLEIAATARFLVRQMRIDWTMEDDPPEVKEALSHYDSLDTAQRREQMERLAQLLDGKGVQALCRLARFEKSPVLSKHAAITLMTQQMVDPAGSEARARRILEAMGTSERTACQWLRAYARFELQPAAAIDDWVALVDAERAVLETSPQRTDAELVLPLLRLQVEFCRRLGRREQMLDGVRHLIALEKDDPGSLTERLRWLTEHEAWEVIDEVAEKYARQFDQHALLVYALAAARKKQGDLEQAAELAEKAYLFAPNDTDLHLAVARSLEGWGQVDWAEREYRHVIASPSYGANTVNAQFWLSGMLHDTGHDEAASQVLEKAVPQMAELVQKDGGTRDLEAVLNEMKSLADYYDACHWREKGDRAKEIEALERAVKHDPNNADVLIAMHRVPEQPKKWREAVAERIEDAADHFRVLIKQAPRNAQYYNQLAWLLGNTRRHLDEALECSLKSLELRPGTAGYLDTLGRCYYARGELEQAVKYQRMAVELEPSSGLMRRQLELFEKALQEKQGGAEKG